MSLRSLPGAVQKGALVLRSPQLLFPRNSALLNHSLELFFPWFKWKVMQVSNSSCSFFLQPLPFTRTCADQHGKSWPLSLLTWAERDSFCQRCIGTLTRQMCHREFTLTNIKCQHMAASCCLHWSWPNPNNMSRSRSHVFLVGLGIVLSCPAWSALSIPEQWLLSPSERFALSHRPYLPFLKW